MKFVLQPLTIHVTNCDAKSRMMGGSAKKRKHGEMLPSNIRAIICGLSNCDKTNILISLLESPHDVYFENVYVYSKSLQQQIDISKIYYVDEIGYFMFSNNNDVIPPSEARPNSIFIFDDMTCDKRWKNTYRRAVTRTLIASISVRRTREYLNIWYTTTRTCWFCSNRIILTWNMFTTITWIRTCRTMNFVCVARLLAKKIWIFNDR